MEKPTIEEVAEFKQVVAAMEEKEETEKTKGLVTNYLRTPGGTCCDKCNVLGKHYLIDEQPLLYWKDKKWLCEKCLGKEE